MRRGFHDQRGVHAGGCSMMRDLWRLTRRTPLSLFTSAVALGYTALLVEVLVFAALDPRGSFSFRGSFVLSGVVSVPAVIVALVYALRSSLRLRQPAWNVLLQLGLSERRIRGYLLRENALIVLAGLLGGIIVLQPVWWVLLRTVYAPYREMGPESLTLSVPGAAISVGVLLGLVLPAHLISTRRIREPVTHVARTRSRLRGFAKTAGFIVAVVTLGILFYGTGTTDPDLMATLGTVVLLGPSLTLAAPAIAGVSSFLLARLLTRHPGSLMRLGMLLQPALRMNAATMVGILAIGLPLGFLGFGATGETGTREMVSRAAHPEGRVALIDGQSFTSEAQATATCRDLRDGCAGVLEFVINSEPVDGSTADTRTRFELIGSRSTAERVVAADAVDGRNLGAGFLAWPWEKHRETRPGGASSYGAWTVLEESNNVASISASEALKNLPAQMLYGPRGTGSREFVPLFSYTLFAGLLFLFVTSIVEMVRARTALGPLTSVGMNPVHRDRAAAAALLVPVGVCSLVVACACAGFCSVLLWRMTGSAAIGISCLALPTSALLSVAPLAMVTLACVGFHLTDRRSGTMP